MRILYNPFTGQFDMVEGNPPPPPPEPKPRPRAEKPKAPDENDWLIPLILTGALANL